MKGKQKLLNLLNEIASKELAPKAIELGDKITCSECGEKSIAIRCYGYLPLLVSKCCYATVKD